MIMMRFEKIKDEISRIAKIESLEECQKEVRDLDYKVNKKTKIKKVLRGNYYYFYVYSNEPGKKENLQEKLGRIHKEEFSQEIESFRRSGKVKELKANLEEY